ncbi:MAG: hypothetical protein WDW38_009454 [Sanguina aurantia]
MSLLSVLCKAIVKGTSGGTANSGSGGSGSGGSSGAGGSGGSGGSGSGGSSNSSNAYDVNFGPGLVDLFSVGGGGGVSVYWKAPFYQAFTSGIRTSEANQSLSYNDPAAGPTTLLQLPSKFRGRNVPDISLNADPVLRKVPAPE